MSQIKTKPTKLTLPEKLTCSSVFWLSVILFVALPFVNNFIMQTAVLNITGNIAYESLAPTLTVIRDLMSVLTAYAGIGAIAAAVAHFGLKKAFGTVILGLLSHTVGLFSSMLAYAVSGARNFAAAVFILGVDAIANTLIYAVILTVLALMRKKRVSNNTNELTLEDKIISKGGAYSYMVTATAIYGAAQLITVLYTMITDFLDPSIGIPINIQEWVYWVTEYLMLFIYVGIGYFIVLGIFWLCKYYHTHFAEE